MQFWDELEGKSLAGTYPLNRWLRTEGNAAWFATRYQDQLAIAYLVEIAGDEDPVVASLEAVSRVQHPNIVQIERVGRANIEGKSVAYAIQEPTEDNLSDALRERPLTTEETTQIVESLTSGLGALHSAGLLHGQVKPTTVLAVGDTVKLRSDCVRKVAAADKDKPATYATDVRDMGALIFECLTQRKLAEQDDPAIAKLPAPFASIVKNTVARRWGLADVAVALRKPVIENPRPPASAAGPAIPKPIENPAPPTPAAAKPTPPPPPPQKAAYVASPTASADLPQKRGGGVRIIALVAVVLALGAIWYFFRASHAKTAATQDAATFSAAPTAGDTTAAPTPPTPAPEAAAPAPPPTQMPPAAGQQRALDATPNDTGAASAAGGHKIWRVVVYTYGDQTKARQRVAVILAAHPDLKPEVFTVSGHGPYLVTIGGPVDRDEALNIRSHARREGMARDAYIQNYTH